MGIFAHAALAAAGLSTIVMRSAQAYEVVRVLGALYLLALGAATLLRLRKPSTSAKESGGGAVSLRSAWLITLLNPKAAAAYLTLVP